MIKEIIEKWTPEITGVLYRLGEKRMTIKYMKIHVQCKYEFKDDVELFQLLDAIDNAEYVKHGIFPSSLALRDTGKRLPSEAQFGKVYQCCKDSSAATYTDVCIKERERAFRVASELAQKRKASIPSLW
ncbi:MAG TPA: hypothetical protein PK325_01420 [Cyclobacteriaceae bacterium]|nr:hypothetical protein [Cyclobacteriaceae bacterium]HMV08071.1 hypothetical protein [Cyclobacteriaceae bacterium]HMV88287.1 hypothetical protein [Cyclobacteriaceae bacterium]HMX00712.1 hypothetical protein [Cyclobacteriaceae bacterium]HMX49413.1 hypothetical protein [Cyclobacteriaceae bacterium]